MKTILTTMLVLFTLNCTFAQKVAIVTNDAEVKSIKATGVGSLTLPADVTATQVEAKSKYYTQYFTISFDDKTKKATFTMVENSEMGRAVIQRFLMACEVQEVRVGSELLSTYDFYMKFLK